MSSQTKILKKFSAKTGRTITDVAHSLGYGYTTVYEAVKEGVAAGSVKAVGEVRPKKGTSGGRPATRYTFLG